MATYCLSKESWEVGGTIILFITEQNTIAYSADEMVNSSMDTCFHLEEKYISK